MIAICPVCEQKDLPLQLPLLHMRYLTLLALALLLCSSAALCQTNGTTPEDLNTTDLRALVVESSAKLESYRFSMEMAQDIDLINLSSMEAQRLYTRSMGLGSANMTDRAMKLVMASFTYAKGNEVNASAVALEEYLLNNSIYLKQDGNWTVLRLPAMSKAWSQQNTMEQQVNMLNNSNLTLIGSETVEGQSCFKVSAKIDMRAYAGQLSGEVASYLPVTSANSTDLFRNMTLDVYYWITKDAHLLKKTDVHEVINVTPQSLGLPATGQEMRVNSTTSMIFEGFNESVNIVLPSIAGRAQPFPLGLAASNEAVSVASNGSEMGPNESISNTARLNESIPNITGSSDTAQNEEQLSELIPNTAKLNESAPITAKLNESKSWLNESISKLNGSIPSTKKLDESKSRLSESVSRLNKSMPDAARLNDLKLRLNATMPNAALPGAKRSNATSSNATSSNATLLNATLLNATMQENRTIQAASTPWRIFL